MNNQHQNDLSDQDLEASLGDFAHDLEAQFPRTDEEILAMFKSLDVSEAPSPNVRKFENFLKEHLEEKSKTARGLAGIFRRAKGALAPSTSPAEFALPAGMAARKGKKMTPELQAKIEASKKKSRKRGGQDGAA